MQWHFEDQYFADEGAIGILHLRGYLGEESLDQFAGAVGWALVRSRGPLVIDLTHLLGLGDSGRAALWDAAHRIGSLGRPVSVCRSRGLEDLAIPRTEDFQGMNMITVNDDLTAALVAVTALNTPAAIVVTDPGHDR